MNKPVCAITKNRSIKRAAFEALSEIDIPDLNGKKILLKPNIGRNVKKNLGINTSPTVTNAVYQYLKKKFRAQFFDLRLTHRIKSDRWQADIFWPGSASCSHQAGFRSQR